MELWKVLKGIEIFADLPDDDLHKIACIGEKLLFESDAEIFHENDMESHLYIVISGRVQVYADISKTDTAVLHTILPGKLFGEFAFIDQKARSATAVAKEQSEVMKFERDKMMELFNVNPAMGYAVMFRVSQILARRIRQTAHELKVSLMWEHG
jgi:CRP-like cAMP-binding protein